MGVLLPAGSLCWEREAATRRTCPWREKDSGSWLSHIQPALTDVLDCLCGKRTGHGELVTRPLNASFSAKARLKQESQAIIA